MRFLNASRNAVIFRVRRRQRLMSLLPLPFINTPAFWNVNRTLTEDGGRSRRRSNTPTLMPGSCVRTLGGLKEAAKDPRGCIQCSEAWRSLSGPRPRPPLCKRYRLVLVWKEKDKMASQSRNRRQIARVHFSHETASPNRPCRCLGRFLDRPPQDMPHVVAYLSFHPVPAPKGQYQSTQISCVPDPATSSCSVKSTACPGCDVTALTHKVRNGGVRTAILLHKPLPRQCRRFLHNRSYAPLSNSPARDLV